MKKISYEKALERFQLQGRTDIVLCEDEYNGWKEKSKFWDKIVKDWFWAIPKNVYVQKSCHPARSVENRKNTNIEKYGNNCSLHGDTDTAKKIQEKVKKTLVKKYGADNPFKSKEIKEKISTKLKEKYGVEHVSQLEEIKNKKRETTIRHFGVAHHMQSIEVKEKFKNTSMEKYNVEHPSKNETIKNRKKNTFLEKYNVEHPFALSGVVDKKNQTMIERYGTTNSWLKPTKIITGENTTIKEWYKSQSGIKPSYGWILKHFIGENEIKKEQLEKILSQFDEKKTSLEIYSESVFNSKHYNKKIEQLAKPYKPDFKLSENIFVNVDGLYWHSDVQKEKEYHFNLRKDFEELNLRIFQFREDEIKNKTAIVQSIIDNALGKTQYKIYARKCELCLITQEDADLFLEQNHLMGTTNAKHLGLKFNGKLVSILSYKQKSNICKIERFCSQTTTSVVGGFSKLLKYLENNFLYSNVSEIHNWVDLRYGLGKHLEEKGFRATRDTLGWKWTDYTKTYNRLRCRANMDSRKLTEKEYSEELGWERIYDAGQRLYIKTL